MRTFFLSFVFLFFVLLASVDSAHSQPDETTDGEREILYWVAPMDSNFRRDEPGKSPMGMNLVPVYADEVAPPGQARVNLAMQQTMNLRTSQVQEGRLWRRIDTVGQLNWDASTLQRINSRIDGWIEQISVAEVGDRVEAGQLLYTIYSPELVNAQEDLQRAVARDDGGLIRSAQALLDTLGVQAAVIEQIKRSERPLREVPWYAPGDGYVTQIGARAGMRVTPATEIMELASLDSIWLTADVAGRQVDWLAEGQGVEFETDYRPGQTFRSEVSYLYPALDPVTRTRRVRINVENPERLLQPGMWASVRIFAGPVNDQVYIAREALIRTGQSERVILQIDSETFEVREVRSGMESGDFVAIEFGLSAGERVVTSGQFLLDSEASRSAGAARLEGGDHAHH